MRKRHENLINLLVVEDEDVQRKLLTEFLRDAGYRVFAAPNQKTALQILEDADINIALLDIRLPDADGLTLLKNIRSNFPFVKCIMVTAMNDVNTAVAAMKNGAVDYIVKPVNFEVLREKLRNLSRDIVFEEKLFSGLRDKVELPSVVYRSDKMKKILQTALKVAPSETPILLTGESGTGKSLLARIIHEHSKRKEGPFIDVNIAAIPETLIEAELFGYKKGAFTGAYEDKRGILELANNGTLFLDEIGELALNVQVKLLKSLETGRIIPLGASTEKIIDFRLITATNKDIEQMVKEGKFREDLYYRINVVHIYIPPLRERREDIVPLLDYFLKKYAEIEEKTIKGFSADAQALLVRYPYPGNIRELENIVHRAVVFAEEEYITKKDLPDYLLKIKSDNESISLSELKELNLNAAIENLERELIKRALEIENGVKSRAAKRLGISERVLRYKMGKLNLE